LAQRPVQGPFSVQNASPSGIALTVQGAKGQTGDLLDVFDSAGKIKAKIDASGNITANSIQANISLPVPAQPLIPSLLYPSPTGALSRSPLFFYNNQQFGFFTQTPRAGIEFAKDVMFDQNVKITDFGPNTLTLGSVPGLVDQTGVLNFFRGKAAFGAEFTQSGISDFTQTPLGANEWGLYFGCHTTILPTRTKPAGGTVQTPSYEKACLFVDHESDDQSDYTNSLMHDAIGGDIRGGIRGGASNARAWGINPWCTISASSDGNCIGAEIDVSNESSDISAVNLQTTKAAALLFSVGMNPVSAGMMIESSSNNNRFHKGVWSDQDYIGTGVGDSFLELGKSAGTTHMFRVKGSGQTLIGDLENNSTLNDYDPVVYGVLNVLNYMSVLASGSEKNAFYILSDNSVTTHRIGTTRYDNSVSFWPLALETSGNQVLLLTTDPFVQWTKSFTALTPKSAAGTAALRNNAGTLELSNNGGAWGPVNGGSGTGTGSTGYLTRWTGATTLGNSDCTDDIIGTSTIACAFSVNQAAYLQIENDDAAGADHLVQAALVAQVGADATKNILVGATNANFSAVGFIQALNGYISVSAGMTNGLVVQTAAGNILLYPTGGTTLSQHNANAATYIQVENDTNNVTSQAVFSAAYGSGGTNNILMGATSPLFTVASQIPSNAGYVSSGSSMSNGLYLQSLSGNVTIYPTSGVTLSEHDANAANYLESVNTTSGSAAQASIVAISNQANGKMYLGSTSAGYVTTNNIPASAGYIDSGADNTNGLFIQAESGPIKLIGPQTTYTAELKIGRAHV